MREIIIGFSRSSLKFPIISYLIMFWETIYWSLKLKKVTIVKQSHCYLKFDTRKIFDDYMVYHAANNMMHYLPYSNFLKYNKVTKEYKILVSEEKYREIRKKLNKKIGEPYGYLQNIGIVITDILSLSGIEKNNPWKNGYNCSEAIGEFLIYIDSSFISKVNLNRIKPQGIKILFNKYYGEDNGR